MTYVIDNATIIDHIISRSMPSGADLDLSILMEGIQF